MRFIHTGDWHLGKLLRERSLVDDQRFTLRGLVRLAEELRPDAMVVAGDVYDRAVAPTEAVARAGRDPGDLTPRPEGPGGHDRRQPRQRGAARVPQRPRHARRACTWSARWARSRAACRSPARDGVDVVFWPLAYTDPETARWRPGSHRHPQSRGGAAGAAGPVRELMRRRRPQRGRRPRLRHRGAAVASPSGRCRSAAPARCRATSSRASTTSPSATCTGPSASASACATRGRCSSTRSTRPTTASPSRVVDLDADGAVTVEERHLPVRRDLVRLRGSLRRDHGAARRGRATRRLTSRSSSPTPIRCSTPCRSSAPCIPTSCRSGARRGSAETRASESLPTSADVDPGPLRRSSSARSPAQQLSEAQQHEVDGALTAARREEREVVA